MSKIYDCDITGVCPYAEFNSSGYACRNFCGMGVDEDAPEDWGDEEDDEDLGFDDYEPEIDESMNPYDGTYDGENDVTDLGDW